MSPEDRIRAILNEHGICDPDYLEGALAAIKACGDWALGLDKNEITGKQRNQQHEKIARQARKLLRSLQDADATVICELDLSGAKVWRDSFQPAEDFAAAERIAFAAEQSKISRRKGLKRGYRILALQCVMQFERCRGEPATASETGPCGLLFDAACDLLRVDSGIDRRRYLQEAVTENSGIGLEVKQARAKPEQK